VANPHSSNPKTVSLIMNRSSVKFRSIQNLIRQLLTPLTAPEFQNNTIRHCRATSNTTVKTYKRRTCFEVAFHK